jgi:Carboxypeptidase regulatory-like domain
MSVPKSILLVVALGTSGCAVAGVPTSNGELRTPAPVEENTYTGWERFTLTGVVREEASTRPLSGVLVRALADGVPQGRMSITDDQGTYRLEGLEAGSYTIEAARAGYYTERREIGYHTDASCVECPPSPVQQTLNFNMRQQHLSTLVH